MLDAVVVEVELVEELVVLDVEGAARRGAAGG